jgi:hypothetical protein
VGSSGSKLALAVVLALGAAGGGCSLGDHPDRPPQLAPESEADDRDSSSPSTELSFPTLATRNTVRVPGADPAADAAGVASLAFPATSATNRPTAVVLVEREDWQAAVTAAVLAANPIGAPLLISDDGELPDSSAAALEHLEPTGSDLSQDAQVIRIGERPPQPDGYRTARIEGADAYERAAAIDRFFTAARGGPTPNVVVTTGERPEYALPAAAWSARSGDTVLLVERNRIPPSTRDALAEHEQPRIFVLGPRSAISDRVVESLGELGETQRIAAAQPVQNAIAFARYEQEDFGWGATVPGYNFTVANVERPLDAAAAATLATRGVFAPLLLTDEAGTLPPPLERYFLSVQPGYEDDPGQAVYNRVWILGDTEAVSLAQQAQLDAVTELVPVQPQAP